MKKTGLFFWPEGGNVEIVTQKVFEKLQDTNIIKKQISDIEVEDLKTCDYYIIGGSTVGAETWQEAEDSNKWAQFFILLDRVDLQNKTVAFFGLGDQILYPSHFVDGLGVFKDEFGKRNAKIVGEWPTEGYEFIESQGMSDDRFFGLALDHDQQPELTDSRIENWIEILRKTFGI